MRPECNLECNLQEKMVEKDTDSFFKTELRVESWTDSLLWSGRRWWRQGNSTEGWQPYSRGNNLGGKWPVQNRERFHGHNSTWQQPDPEYSFR